MKHKSSSAILGFDYIINLASLGDDWVNYATNPGSLIAASQVVATEFQTIDAANNY